MDFFKGLDAQEFSNLDPTACLDYIAKMSNSKLIPLIKNTEDPEEGLNHIKKLANRFAKMAIINTYLSLLVDAAEGVETVNQSVEVLASLNKTLALKGALMAITARESTCNCDSCVAVRKQYTDDNTSTSMETQAEDMLEEFKNLLKKHNQ